MEFINSFKDFGVLAVVVGCLMWYIWQKDKIHRQETEALRKSIDRLTSSVEKVLTFLYEEGK